jgi:soluble lytic murein transglycosylase-like protein
MAGRSPIRRQGRTGLLTVLCALLAVVADAHAQTCVGPLPKPGISPAPGSAKFALIAQQCPGAAAPESVQQAAQLDLYERGSVSIAMSEPLYEPAPPAPALMPPAAPQMVPARPDPDIERIRALAPAVTAAARANGVDPLLLHAIAHVESRHRTTAVSPAGARGVMQVMPATARRFGVADERRLFDADINLNASAAYLRTLHSRYGDDLRLVLAAYNAGEGAVERYGRNVPPYAETLAYVRDVLAIYRRLAANFAVTPAGTLVARGDER